LLSEVEEARFWTFYRKTSEVLFRKAYRMCCGQQADADDAHQRAYLKALEHWGTVSGLDDQRRAAWLATTLTREILQMWRTPHRSRETGLHDDAGRRTGEFAGVDGPDSSFAADQYRKACRGIAQLTGRQRDVIALHCLAGYEISEVSDMLEISSSTVRVHLHAGRQRLREIMGGEEGSA
jgi:RNA polymerase sigma factor (sigma-70 family)